MRVLVLATKRRAHWALTDHAALLRTLLKENDARWYGPGHEEYNADKPLASVLSLFGPWKPDFIYHDESGSLPYWSAQPIVPDISSSPVPTGFQIQDACHHTKEKTEFAKLHNFHCVLMGCKTLIDRTNMRESIDRPFVYLPHSVPSHIFKDYGNRKQFDVMMYGVTKHGWYKHRRRLFDLLRNSGLKCAEVPHPGRALYTAQSVDYAAPNINDWQEENLARTINSAWLGIAASNALSVPVGKYYEIPACRTYPIGDLPDEARPFFEGKMLELRPRFSDEEIVNKVTDVLSDKERLRIKTDEAYQNIVWHHTTQARIRQLFEQLDRMVL